MVRLDKEWEKHKASKKNKIEDVEVFKQKLIQDRKKLKESEKESKKFSIYHNGIINTTPNGEIDLKQFLELIKQENILVEKIRACKDKNERDKLKSKLSYVTFAGTFETRANNKIMKSSELACFDYDDIEDLEKVKKELIKDKYTHCLFESPSGKGLKLIVKIPEVKNNEEYKQYWVSISEHFKGVKVDQGTKDISRACYLSVDKKPFFNSNSEIYTKKSKENSSLLTTPTENIGEDKSRSAKEMSAIISLIKKDLPREQVYEEMNVYAKWNEGTEAYKKKTYEKAFDWVEQKNKEKGEKKEKKEKKKFINRYVNEENKIIIEQVYDKEKNKSQLCIYNFNTDEIRYVDFWESNGFKYFPKEGEELEKGAVLLPSKAEEYDDDELNKEIRKFIISWLDVPEEVIKFGIWNIKRSWVYDKFNSLNYLRALGDIGLGKSRYLNTFGSIHYSPIFTTGATTPAPLFRILDKWGGTLVMDEADFKRSEESEDIIKIINQGFEKGNFIMRCDQNDASKISFFDPYSPKILATRRTFQDKATESRCITHVMEISEVKNIPVNLNNEFWKSAESLRNKLLMWRFKNYFKIDMNKKYEFEGLEPRVKQIVNSYVSLFADNEKEMDEFKNYIKNYQEELIDDRQSSFDGVVVGSIYSLLENGNVEFNAKDIIEVGQIMGRGEKLIHSRSLSSSLKSLGFKKREDVRIGNITKKLIPLEPKHLKHLLERYGFDVSVVSVVTETSQKYNKGGKEQKELNVGGGRAIRYNRNNRNNETETETEEVKVVKIK